MSASSQQNNRVLLAMSGGVDSSVAAVRLIDEGFDVVGMTLMLTSSNEASASSTFSNSSSEALDAQRVCATLGIEHHTLDYRSAFNQQVIDPFCSSYCAGETPNPCIECNKHIKFTALEKLADSLGCAFIATGHYARTRLNPLTMRAELLCATDLTKDQSYVLWPLSQDILKRVIFPLGELTKQEVRTIAAHVKLPTASKQESQDICFIPNGHYARFIEEHCGYTSLPGPIKNTEGHKLGEHTGLIHYTIGQRKGLGIAASEPLYVLAKDVNTDSLVVGTKSESFTNQVYATQVNWVSIDKPKEALNVQAKCLYRQRPQDALLHIREDGSVRLSFQQPVPLPAPGQSLVCYNDDLVLCGGIIANMQEPIDEPNTNLTTCFK